MERVFFVIMAGLLLLTWALPLLDLANAMMGRLLGERWDWFLVRIHFRLVSHAPSPPRDEPHGIEAPPAGRVPVRRFARPGRETLPPAAFPEGLQEHLRSRFLRFVGCWDPRLARALNAHRASLVFMTAPLLLALDTVGWDLEDCILANKARSLDFMERAASYSCRGPCQVILDADARDRDSRESQGEED